MKRVLGLAVVVAMMASVATAEWHYGLGTGLTLLNVEGDQGLNTRLVGPVQFDVDLAPDEFNDLIETAYGVGGYATDGQWVIRFTTGFLELRDGASTTLASGVRVGAELYQEVTLGELSVGYTMHRTEKLSVTPYLGVRYTEHELGAELDITTAAGTSSADRSVDHDWTDARVGVAVDVPLAEKWIWGSSVEAGFGGSDGTYQANTGVTWMFATHWATRVGFNYLAIDFEEGSRGDDDWYLYDADEFGWGLNVMYNW